MTKRILRLINILSIYQYKIVYIGNIITYIIIVIYILYYYIIIYIILYYKISINIHVIIYYESPCAFLF